MIPGGLALLHAAAATIRSDAEKIERRNIPWSAPVAHYVADWLTETSAFIASHLHESSDFAHLVNDEAFGCRCGLHRVLRPAASLAAAYLNGAEGRGVDAASVAWTLRPADDQACCSATPTSHPTPPAAPVSAEEHEVDLARRTVEVLAEDLARAHAEHGGGTTDWQIIRHAAEVEARRRRWIERQ